MMNNHIVKRVLTLVSGTIGGQIITIASMVILTRLYSPEDFGVYSSFSSLASILIPISTLCLTLSIFLEEKDENINKIYSLVSYLSIFSLFFLYFIICLIKYILNVDIEIIKNLGDLIYLIPICVFAGALQQNIYQLSLKKERFYNISKSNIYSALISNLYKIITGFFSFPGVNLIIGYILMYIYQFFYLSYSGKKNQFSLNKTDAKFLLYKYKDLVFFRTPQVFINTLSEFLPIYFLITYYGAAQAGFYSLARSVLAAPSGLIGKAITDAFLPKFSEYKIKEKNINTLLLKSLFVTLFFSIIAYIPFIIFGEYIFSIIFGSRWKEAGILSSVMSFWLIATLTTRPIIAAITIKNLQKHFMFFEIVSFSLKFSLLYWGVNNLSSYIDLILYFSILNLVSYMILSLICFYFNGVKK